MNVPHIELKSFYSPKNICKDFLLVNTFGLHQGHWCYRADKMMFCGMLKIDKFLVWVLILQTFKKVFIQ